MEQSLREFLEAQEILLKFIDDFFGVLSKKRKNKGFVEDNNPYKMTEELILNNYKKHNGVDNFLLENVLNYKPERAFLVVKEILKVKDPVLEHLIAKDPKIFEEYQKIKDTLEVTPYEYNDFRFKELVKAIDNKVVLQEEVVQKLEMDEKNQQDLEIEALLEGEAFNVFKDEELDVIVKGLNEPLGSQQRESAEAVISKNAKSSYWYATEFLKAPFKKGEKAIIKNEKIFIAYNDFVFDLKNAQGHKESKGENLKL